MAIKNLKSIKTKNNTYIVADKVTLDGNVLNFWKSLTPPETEDTLVYSADLSEFKTTEYDFSYDVETGLFALLENGEVKTEATILSGGGGSGGSTSVVKLTNQNGTSTFAIASGSKAELKFIFTSTEDDIPTGNGVCQIIVNSVTKTTLNIAQGLTTLDVSQYLTAGSNTVRVRVTDVYGNSKTLVYTISVIDLYITSTFDSTTPYSGEIIFKYTPYGAIEKTIHLLVDGEEVETSVTSLSGKQITTTFSAMSHGVHTIEVYADAEMDGLILESGHLVYEIICIKDGKTTPMIASVYNVESVQQGALVAIPYIVYDPTKLACDITLTVLLNGSEIYSTQEITVDRSQQIWNTRKYPVGVVTFQISYGNISKSHTLTVTESDIKIEAVTNDLELYLTSTGRSNGESNPAIWEYDNITTNFENFNWDSVGWVNDENGDTCLRLSGDAKAEIQFKPFSEDLRTYGKTIELEFAIRDVNNRDAVAISCMSGGIGFEVKADTAYIQSEQSNVFCNYKEEERVRISFVVESRSEYRLLSIYLNGILSDTIQYPSTDNFTQSSPVGISIGSPYCGVDLYTIRSYTTALSSPSIVTNFIADMTDIIRKTEVNEQNDIYDEYGNISFEKTKERNSVMIIIGELPQSKGDKKKVTIVYYDAEDSTLDFTEAEVSIDVQGTSSQFFIRKNWKLKFSNEHYIDIDQLPAKVICIKVDYAEATGTHNTQNANFVETLYSESIPAQEAEPKVRTTIYGKPILLFHQENENSTPVFYGKSNYNVDKGAESIFGFTEDYEVESWEFLNNTSDACNFLGEIPENWGDDFEARYPEECTDISNFKRIHDWVVSTKNNIEKFKNEFEQYFNLHYSLIYYVYTFFALMVDQRAKNMFLTIWNGIAYPYMYDNDTSFGINNEGQLVFDYYYEDTDQLDGANVYNGQNSVLWCNFREAFADEIKATYQDLRNNKKITYDKLIEQFITKGSDKWSESIYNEDGDFKYISMLRSDNDASNLGQVRGSGEEHFRYFIENRLNYCDSKWYASDYADDYVSLRIYTPSEWAGVEPNADITVTPYSNMYAGVRYKANGTLYQQRAEHNIPVTFEAPDETFNDTETGIYGASQISSLGDLAPLYCGSINVSKANKLIILKIGDGTEGYSNTNLKELSVGTNRLLKKIDVQNCPNLAIPLGLANCPNVEEIYAKGSGITGVELPESGYLKIMELPATITNFTLKNQLYIETLTFEGYDNIKTLWVENCPTIDTLDILDKCVNIERVRLTNVNWSYPDASVLYELIDRNIAGIDENGTNIDYMWVDGTCHISTLTGAEYLYIKEAFPYMTITYDTLTAELIFMSEDGSTELARQTIQNGGNGTDPVAAGTISTPTKTSTAQYNYTYSGWSLTSGGSANSNALKNVEADRKVYVAFTATVRTYTVKFYNGTTLLQTVTNVPYGSTATYTGKTPTNTSTGNTADFEFYGWSPSPTNIQGNTNCYAQFYDLREITDSWTTIATNCLNGTATEKYAIGAFKTLDIGAVDLPYIFYGGSAVVYNDEIHILGSSSYQTSHYKWNGTEWTKVSTLPYDFYYGSAVVYNDEIHILGSGSSSYKKYHYKWNGTEWTEVSTLPYSFYESSAVVYNDEIHILGSGSSSYKKYHYKWNGTEWTEVSTLPYDFYRSSAVIYNDEIHILGSGSSSYKKYHYKWNGTEWTEVSTLPYDFYYGSAVVYNDEIHILGSSSYQTSHYKWNGTEWTKVSTLPYDFYYGSAVVYNDEIHILGSYSSYDYKSFYHYSTEAETWNKIGLIESIPMEVVAHNHDELPDGQLKWESLGKLPYGFYYGSAVIYNDEIHILGSNDTSYRKSHYKWNGTEWTKVSTLPYDFYYGSAVVYNDEIHILGSGSSSYKKSHYKWNGTEWTEVSTLPYSFYESSAVVYNDEIHILGSDSSSYRQYHYKWNGTEWISVSTLPYSFYEGSAVVYNDEIHILGSAKYHYKWNGTEWISVSTLPYSFYNGSAVVHNDEIHILGSANALTSHYKWNGTEWISVSTLVYKFKSSSAVVYNDEIHILGSSNSGSYRAFYYMNDINPRATLTFVARNLLSETHAMNSTAKTYNGYTGYNAGGWSLSDMRTYLNETVINTFPEELQNVITEVKKLSDGGYNDQTIISTVDKLWILSYDEIGFAESVNSLKGQGTQYPVFTDANSRKKSKVGEDAYQIHYLRSSYLANGNGFWYVNSYGDGYYTDASGSRCVLLGFCIR